MLVSPSGSTNRRFLAEIARHRLWGEFVTLDHTQALWQFTLLTTEINQHASISLRKTCVVDLTPADAGEHPA